VIPQTVWTLTATLSVQQAICGTPVCCYHVSTHFRTFAWHGFSLRGGCPFAQFHRRRTRLRRIDHYELLYQDRDSNDTSEECDRRSHYGGHRRGLRVLRSGKGRRRNRLSWKKKILGFATMVVEPWYIREYVDELEKLLWTG